MALEYPNHIPIVEGRKWTTPKTDWNENDKFNIWDYSRIIDNILYIQAVIHFLDKKYKIIDMGDKVTYETLYYPKRFNHIEVTLEKINDYLIQANIGETQIFRSNGVFIDWQELNRIEGVSLMLFEHVVNWYNARRMLPVLLNVNFKNSFFNLTPNG